DAFVGVVLDDVLLVERSDIVDIGPETRPEIAVHVVAADDEAGRDGELAAAAFPVAEVPCPAVECDLVAIEENAGPVRGDAVLAIAMHAVPDHLRSGPDVDACSVVQAHLVVPHEPVL